MVGIGVGRVMIGVDAHKRTHTLVAVDQVGRRLADKTVRHQQRPPAGGRLPRAEAPARWRSRWRMPPSNRRLEADLLRAGQRVVRVPTRLMAERAAVGREPGKSDPIDAQAVAMAALRHPDLPVARSTARPGRSSCCRTTARDLVMQRTECCATVRWYLHELDPDLRSPSAGFAAQVVDQLLARLDGVDGVVARLARELLARCRELTGQITGWSTSCATWSAARASAGGHPGLRGAGGD